MNYKVGEIVRGIVTGIQPYGAFIKIDDETTGLVHISEVSNGYVKNIEDFIKVDSEYSFYILEYNEETHHAKLSFKKINDADKAKRKPSFSKHNFKSLSEYCLYFNDTISIVDAEEEKINNKEIEVTSKEEVDFDFDDSIIRDLPDHASEKDILHIQQNSFNDRTDIDYLVVICNKAFELQTRSICEIYNGKLSDNIIYLKENTGSVYFTAIHKLLVNKMFKVIYISDEDNLRTLAFYRLLKQRFVDDHPDIDYKDYFYFFFSDQVKETKDLVNKEGYYYCEEPHITSSYNLICYAALYVFGYCNMDVFAFSNGYRKALLDIYNDKSIIKKLLSLKGESIDPVCYLDYFLRHLGIDNIRITINTPEVEIPHFKDNLKTIKEYEGKYLSDIIKDSDEPKIILKYLDSYSLGYITLLILYTALAKKSLHK